MVFCIRGLEREREKESEWQRVSERPVHELQRGATVLYDASLLRLHKLLRKLLRKLVI